MTVAVVSMASMEVEVEVEVERMEAAGLPQVATLAMEATPLAVVVVARMAEAVVPTVVEVEGTMHLEEVEVAQARHRTRTLAPHHQPKR